MEIERNRTAIQKRLAKTIQQQLCIMGIRHPCMTSCNAVTLSYRTATENVEKLNPKLHIG